MRELTDSIKARALQLGFDLVGVAEMRPSEHAAFYREWIGAGRHGEMSYLAREDAVRRRLTPDEVFKSAVVVALNYFPGAGNSDRAGDSDGAGTVARYAQGRDYHKVIKPRLLALLRFIEEEVRQELPWARAFVDTGPVLERELARRAGIGWFGRNTMLINPKRGSYFFLGALLLEIELMADAPFTEEHCGTCNACVSACPTNALLGRAESGAPMIDATRCISYLTIENRGPIPEELRPLMGDRIFGCDICQEVCPWNAEKFVQLTKEASFMPRAERRQRDLLELMTMSEDEWDIFSRGSAIRRAQRAGFLRNVAVALGNVGDRRALPVLQEAAADSEPLVREHAAWAIEQIRTRNEGVR